MAAWKCGRLSRRELTVALKVSGRLCDRESIAAQEVSGRIFNRELIAAQMVSPLTERRDRDQLFEREACLTAP